MTANCACGHVEVTIERKPDFINDCDCGLCRKVGAAWGYFEIGAVTAKGETHSYTRDDKDEPSVQIHSCPHCGSTTHFTLTEACKKRDGVIDHVGVNMRLFDPNALSGVEVRYPSGAAWSGSGPFGYRRPSMIIGETQHW
ncbi:MAG: aldehyde-activating protein [Pseudomonadota bacterium]